MRVLGMISGTSHDGIDVAVVDLAPADGVLDARIELTASTPYESDLRRRLVDALPPASTGLDVVCELDTRLGKAFATAATAALERLADVSGAGPVDVICSHGQTVFHWVEGGRAQGTLQLGQPAWIAAATGLPVVSDLRSADLAAGGQGAPLVPVLDRLLLQPFVAQGARCGALNLGGIANVTVCAPGLDPVAWDIGPANALVDAVVAGSAGADESFDRDGELAGRGRVDFVLLEELLHESYYARPAPKSTGKELFHLGYVEEALTRTGAEPTREDLVATLTELTARTVSDAVSSADLTVLVVSGGGVRNPVMMSRLRSLLPGVRLLVSDELGVPADHKEAVAFALIGWATMNGLAGNVSSCTGAAAPCVLGSITPAPRRSLPQVDRVDGWPDALRLRPPETPEAT